MAAGIAIGALLIAWSHWGWPLLAGDSEVGKRLTAFTIPLPVRLLYGGIVEEVLTRWGLMSALVWGLWRLSGPASAPRTWHFVAGIVLAALLFGLGNRRHHPWQRAAWNRVRMAVLASRA
jgi:hypothetical protein